MDLKRFLVVNINHAHWSRWHEELTIFEVILDYGHWEVDTPLPSLPVKADEIFSLKEWAEACNIGEYNTISGRTIMFIRIK